jgi:teichuronic acid biosynthesis glycosyltransferase TuaG
MAKVSIITPLYNGARYIEQTILSVIRQTYPDWEMIIVDDCSTDHPETVISRYVVQDNRIRLIRLDKNSGAAGARNVAIDQAGGDYIAFLDGDDVWKPKKLERQVSLMTNQDLAFSFTSYEIMAQDGTLTGKLVHAPNIIDYRHYLKNTVIGCLTVMINRQKTGEFRMPMIRSSHDMALWLELMKRGFKAYGIDEVLASYRLVSSSNSANKFQAAEDVWHVYRDIEKLSFFYSIYNLTGYTFHAIRKRL